MLQVFTLKEAWDRLRKEDIRMDRAMVVVDCITNDVQGTKLQRRVEPGGGGEQAEECDQGDGTG